MKKLLNTVKKRMVKVALFIEGKIKSSMNVSNLGGTHPSSPGQVPHVGTGALRNSIDSQVSTSLAGREIAAHVGVFKGPGAKYARRLELGFTGVDGLGRNYHQQARPFLKPALNQNKTRIIDIIKGG